MKDLEIIGTSILFSLVVAGVIYFINKLFYGHAESIGFKNHFNEYRFVSILVLINGMIEVTLFGYCLLNGFAPFIAIWLGVKTAMKWTFEKKYITNELIEDVIDDPTERKRIIEDHKINETKFFYLRFMIGNALNIFAGFMVYKIFG